jgi:hypothetical protein
VVSGSPIATATDAGGIILPDYHHIDITMANGGTFYIKFDGGGLNQLHMTTSPSEPYGQVTTTESSSGVFYLDDTGGRGFNDDTILMVAVKGDVPDDYTIHIKASGYRWTPTPVLNQPPTYNEITYVKGSVDDTFTKADFIYGPQAWKPSNEHPYPIVSEQDMTDPTQTFRFMFVDLKAGTLGPNSLLSGITDNGAVKVEYDITNPAGLTVFNVYTWCNQSNQGQGISWTNSLSFNVANGGKTTGGSGFSVKGTPPPGQGGDVAPGGGQGGSTVSMENSKQSTEKSGFEGKPLTPLDPLTYNGTVTIRATGDPAKNLTPGDSVEYTLDPSVLPGSAITVARFWLYITGSQSVSTGAGTDPDLSLVYNDLPVTPAAIYSDNAGISTAPRSATLAYDVKSAIGNNGVSHLKISLKGPPDSKCRITGGSLLVITKDDTKPPSTIWIDEGCDIVAADPGNGIRVDDPVTYASFDGTVDNTGSLGTLYTISTPSTVKAPPEQKNTFNLGELTATNVTDPIAVRTVNVTPFLAGSGNRATMKNVANGIQGAFLENRNAFLIVSGSTGTGAEPGQPSGVPTTLAQTTRPTLMVIAPMDTTKATSSDPVPAETVSPRYLLPGPLRPMEDLFFSVFRSLALPGSDEAGKQASPVKDQVSSVPSGKNLQMVNLTVITDPPGASVFIDGVQVNGTTPLMFTALPSGDHTVTVTLYGYGSLNSSVHLTRDQEVTLTFVAPPPPSVNQSKEGPNPPTAVPQSDVNSARMDQMQAMVVTIPESNSGGVYVVSNPDQAHILVDGGETSHLTPAAVSNLQKGVHYISVVKEGVTYSSTNRQAEVFPDALTRVVFDTNPIASRMITIESEDFKGDAATINGKGPALTLPATVPVNGAGAYITIRHGDSYRTFTISEFLNNGETWTIKDDMEPLGNVLVNSNPSGADIFLDGFPTGLRTPATVKNVSNGQHIVAVSKPGLLPDEQHFSVVDNPTKEIDTSVDLRLLPYMFGILRVVSTPPGADITIDDVYTHEKTPFNFTYTSVGKYNVKITLGDQTRQFDTEVYPDEIREYAVDFVKDTIDAKRIR